MQNPIIFLASGHVKIAIRFCLLLMIFTKPAYIGAVATLVRSFSDTFTV